MVFICAWRIKVKRELQVNFVHQEAERIELETRGGSKGEYWWLLDGGITVLY